MRAAYESDSSATFAGISRAFQCDVRLVRKAAAEQGWGVPGSIDAREAAAIGQLAAGDSAQIVTPTSPEMIGAAADAAVAEALRTDIGDLRSVADGGAEYIPISQRVQAELQEELDAGRLVVGAQAGAIKRHIAAAREIQGVCLQVFRRIAQAVPDVEEVVAAGPVGQTVAAMAVETRRVEALRCLTGLNPDRETLAGLLNALVRGVREAVDMERQALGLQAARASGGGVMRSAAEPAVGQAGGVIEAPPALGTLDSETAWGLRAMLNNHLQQKRRIEVEGYRASRGA